MASSFTTFKSRFIKSADGTEIYTDAAGTRSPGNPTIVLLAGFSMVKECFNPIFDDPKWMSNAFLVRYDLRGHGRSGKPLNDEAWESRCLAEDFEAVCKEFNVTNTFIMAWSLGATHFVDFASHNTSVSVNGLISVEGALCSDPATILRIGTPRSFQLFADFMQGNDVDAFQRSVLDFITACTSDPMSPNFFRILLEGVILVPRPVAIKLTSRTQNTDVMFTKARSGELDLLLITGGKDKLTNAAAIKTVYEEIGWKKYTYQHLEDGDHIPWLSEQERFRETVLGWVRERQQE
ncbi:hypothetical protein NP233_g12827 [Leucocoprinus birnbaumii]|uniref:AB hydrolase-1 domain-containing protein n=1 Tax=Leucocoprinus birnbaumii TaxID=56174 RepID=A0AAD5VE53_9AGAR|nr:hypothetical protein NP233_g12827 [Leucocoprinus birnbaumii]